MNSRSRHDAPRAPDPPDPKAGEERLLTSDDLFGELVDAPSETRQAPQRTRAEPIRVQVVEPKSRAVQAQLDTDEPPGSGPGMPAHLGAEEMAALLDVFDLPPEGSQAVSAPAASVAPPPPPAPVPPAPARSRGALEQLDSLLDGLSDTRQRAPCPTPAQPAPRPASTEAVARSARLPFDDATEFESLLDNVLSPCERPEAPVAPPPAEELGATTEPGVPRPPADEPTARFHARPARPPAGHLEVDLLGLAASAFDDAAAAPAPAPPPAQPVFGPYRLLERIATGGMAEVFRAKRTGVEGFEKVVAVKRILNHLSDNKEFVDMFVDEAKMVAGLTHPNIVQIFDLGRVGKSYFIAMEYVHGRDLRTIHKRAKERGVRLPLDLSALVVSRVSAALEYAHRKKDDRGRPMRIVHRDVSPQNILISFEGEVKLADFGIAKAQSKATITDRGSLRGKLFYMSPEQASGQPIDRRADLFALGIVFYELITGERPFNADSERSILEAVRECRVRPPRALNPRIPERFENVALRALARDPDERYQDAAEMLRDLERVMRERQTPGAPELARLMAVLFDEREREELPASAPLGSGDTGAGSGDVDVEFDSAPKDAVAPHAGRGDELSIEALMRRFGIPPVKET